MAFGIVAGHAHRHDFQHAMAGFADSGSDRDQLLLVRISAGDELALGRAMVERARGGHAERARRHRLADDLRHALAIFRRRGQLLFRTRTHHIGAQRAVRDQRTDIDRVRLRGERVEIFGEALPIPVEPIVERGAGDFLDALHQPDQPVALVRVRRREADATIPHDHAGDAIVERRAHQLVPARLAVIMGVDVHEARRHDQAVGVDLAPCGAGNLTDFHDPAVLDGHIGRRGLGIGAAVDDRAATDYDIMHRPLLTRWSAIRTAP